MKRFILNLSFCLVIALCSIAMIGCDWFGKKEPVSEPEVTEPAPEEETATEAGTETETATEEAPLPAGEEG